MKKEKKELPPSYLPQLCVAGITGLVCCFTAVEVMLQCSNTKTSADICT
ncbi:hypothetical protein BVRB_5g105950 [Beta vulgaris subsp. vulgaris]|nr:hypothetical protein BVRB_5g105950 [Beta vulgaris subsp. vulgaris]